MSTSEPGLYAGLYAGVDVGAGRCNAVLVRRRARPAARLEVTDRFVGAVQGLAGFCSAARRVAVDAPGGLSAGAHLGDLSVAPKFREGRCSEVPVPGVPPVPWVTPRALEATPGWMRTGFEVWAALAGAGLEVVETFPAAFFHRLHGGRWPPPKSAPDGRAVRLSLLGGLVDLAAEGSPAPAWTHDDIDALACAVVAARGRPSPHSCPAPDGSVMWVLSLGAAGAVPTR